jgi:Tfp pilus assembly protein PilV
MRRGKSRSQRSAIRGQIGFALYEVLMGVAIFAFGVLALGRAVENCLSASTLNAEENRVRLILSNRMAEVQTTPGLPETAKEFTVDTGYGVVKLIQTAAPAELLDDNGAQLTGVHRVTLTAKWTRAGAAQSQQIEFYVYRPG